MPTHAHAPSPPRADQGRLRVASLSLGSGAPANLDGPEARGGFKTAIVGSLHALRTLYRVFASIIRYHRMAARAASQQGGSLPLNDLQGFITSWANQALPLLNLQLDRVGPTLPLQQPTLFVGNHLSYLDIPLLMSQVPVVFLGKAEIAKWPILGSAGQLAGVVFVKRDSDGSRREATRAILDCLQNRGMSLGLFPAGTTTLEEDRPWRAGAFRIARAGKIPVQPFRLTYEPRAKAAFVGKDALLPHLYRLLRSGPVKARIEFGEPLMIEDPHAAAQTCWAWSRDSNFRQIQD